MAEWLKAPLSKSGIVAILSRVRISPFPPSSARANYYGFIRPKVCGGGINVLYQKSQQSRSAGFFTFFEYVLMRFFFIVPMVMLTPLARVHELLGYVADAESYQGK